MEPQLWQKVNDLFFEVLKLAPERRNAFLAEACRGDEPLCKEIETLLSAHQQVDGFIDGSALHIGAQLLVVHEQGLLEGRKIGPYRLVRHIGSGGMGSVFLAEREDEHYHQRVAIKLIGNSMNADFVVYRFRHERQILAHLDHPNIAHLLDGGTTDQGMPYLVMEYVEGQPIDRYCDERRLSITERLKLFRKVCGAVGYAHQNLVIHRDLKPANILITKDGVPKLLDFGIAKLLQEDAALPADLTMTALPWMTPEYASPEQVRGELVNTATDVYSLGVLLYQLLSGRKPYRLKSRSPHEIAKIICEVEPEKPSDSITRIEAATNGQGAKKSQTAEEISRARQESPHKLGHRLAGDLDTIVLRAMHKEPQRRYASVEQLSEDIRRYLEGLPVVARKDTARYRAAKFFKRNKVAVTAAIIVLLALCGGLAATLWEAHIARVERAKAERRFNDVRELANSLVFDVHDSIQNLPGSTAARKLIVDRGLRYLDQLSGEAKDDVSLERELARAYGRLGQVQGGTQGSNLGDTRAALESYRKAVALSEAVLKHDPHNLRDLQNLALTYATLATALGWTGDKKGASANNLQAMRIREMLVQKDPANVDFRSDLARSYREAGAELVNRNDFAGAAEKYRQSLELSQQVFDAKPKNADYRRELSFGHKRLGAVYIALKRFDDAMEQYQAALSLDEKLIADTPDDAQARYNITFTYSDLGFILKKNGRLEEALAYYRKALEIRKSLAAADPHDAKVRGGIANTYEYMGSIQKKLGHNNEALSDYQASAAIRKELVASDPANKTWHVYLAFSYAYIGFGYAALAEQSDSDTTRLALWRRARSYLQQAFPTLEQQDQQHALIGDEAGYSEKVSQEIKQCDTAIRKLQKVTS